MPTTLWRLLPRFDALILDAYGVFWCNNIVGALPGAKEAMQALVSQGKVVGILSNAPELSGYEIEKLKKHGILEGIHFHFFITSGEVTRLLLLERRLPFPTPRRTYSLFGRVPHPLSPHERIFRNTGFEQVKDRKEADFIYVSVPHLKGEDQQQIELFRDDVRALLDDPPLPMLCPNPDIYAMEGSPPRATVRPGAIAKLYEEMGGGPILYVGKPHSEVYKVTLEECARRGAKNPRRILMIGDTPETDIRGANAIGLPSALLTHSGIMADRASKSDLKALLSALPKQDQPNYLLPRLALDAYTQTPST